jgi:hypothetical protein
MTASDIELRKHGLPRRPDKKTHPRTLALFEQTLSRPLHLVQSEFKVDDVKIRPFGTDNILWAGAIINSPPSGQTFRGISAQWGIPACIPPSNAQLGTYAFDIWVGMDGQTSGGDFGLGGIGVGAGVTTQCSADTAGQLVPGSQSAFCWFGWANESAITGLSVSPGDTVVASLCGASGNKGILMGMSNATTGQVLPLQPYTAPSDTTFQGSTAEWIVSWDQTSIPPPLGALPNFGGVIFTNATSTSTIGPDDPGQEVDLTSAELLDLVSTSESGEWVTEATAIEENATTLTVCRVQ